MTRLKPGRFVFESDSSVTCGCKEGNGFSGVACCCSTISVVGRLVKFSDPCPFCRCTSSSKRGVGLSIFCSGSDIVVVGGLTTDEGFLNHVAIEVCICKTCFLNALISVVCRTDGARERVEWCLGTCQVGGNFCRRQVDFKSQVGAQSSKTSIASLHNPLSSRMGASNSKTSPDSSEHVFSAYGSSIARIAPLSTNKRSESPVRFSQSVVDSLQNSPEVRQCPAYSLDQD